LSTFAIFDGGTGLASVPLLFCLTEAMNFAAACLMVSGFSPSCLSGEVGAVESLHLLG
jgi:hypothetical protein